MISAASEPKVILERENQGVYEIEGLYPGYGLTIGNSLRRVLLSSLEGAAVTSVKIAGIGHEFGTIDGVLEDVVEIILNLKKLRFRIHGQGPYTATLSVKGEREVKAKDLQSPSQLEVVSPDLHIATITNKRTTLEVELEVSRGLGYQPVEQRSKEKVEIGVIALDAAFSPVRHVNYEVENMRVGDRTDYNRLRLHITTDGSISPREALVAAIDTVVDQFKAIRPRETKPEIVRGEEAPEEEMPKAKAVVPAKVKIADAGLSARTTSALVESGIKTVGALTKKKEEKLRGLEGLGEKGVEEIKEYLASVGLSLKE
ncbi:MAG: DNA-directed RNA polymerase subunit alpha [Candidatus Sungbacteria bacterium]|uniref:DNA-directed RNA polymerase subunit alpha n=1 Tax=Candidatus Sungiibacteriota bacterium TaxID=2750080 RepID=A0A931WNT3_9BACT|nr:DNA-directed RNA polymerase subunit alpha [Candidatus Sungbacteria bacterium]